MIFGEFGIATDGYSWILVMGLAVLWGGSLILCTYVKGRGWVAVPTSLFGLAWLGFGLNILLRFLILSWDSVLFGNGTFRLADLPIAVINKSLILLWLYWIIFSGAFFLVSREKLPNPIAHLGTLTPDFAFRVAPFTTVATCACIYLSNRGGVPTALVTPLALIGAMWVIPAALIWWQFFFQNRPSSGFFRAGIYLTIVLAPGLLQVWLSPYRENLLTVFLVPFSASLFANRRPRLSIVILVCVVILTISTIFIKSYRQILWMGDARGDLAFQVSDWKENPLAAPLAEPLRRFHALDSFLLTLDLVPATFPHSGEEIFISSFMRGVIPRLFYSSKEADDRAIKFGKGIWSFGDSSDRSDAAISPSMPGDLYSTGGVLYVFIGAGLWGILVGMMESWTSPLPPYSKSAMIVLFGFQVAAAIERDFAHTIATTVQFLVVLFVLVCFYRLFGIPKYRYIDSPSNWL
jgi:hypothetical protein